MTGSSRGDSRRPSSSAEQPVQPDGARPALYDSIGSGYDTTRRADPYLTSRMIARLDPSPGRVCLDLACGSGNYTRAIAERGLTVHGADRSRLMIAAAAAKRAGVAAPVSWTIADAAALPFGARAFGGVLCTLALHHFPALGPVFTEVRRILEDGRFVIFTATREQMAGYWLHEYFPRALAASTEAMPSLREIMDPLRAAGFTRIELEPYEVAPDLDDLFLYSGKHRPTLYLDPRVRANISTFAAQADPAEIASGCARLADDIATGRIEAVVDRFRSDSGDYLFVTAEA